MNASHTSNTGPLQPQRVLSIDILRGLTVALMILVNDPGDPQQVYRQLDHAEWNGYTAADLVFPNFLFLAGASLVFSLQSRIERANVQGTSKLELARALGRRSVNLLLLKLFIAGVPTFRFRRVRIFGVLFRTALCSLAGGVILLGTLSASALLTMVGAILIAYSAALRTPFLLAGKPPLNQPLLDADNNLSAWIDRRIAHFFHGHLHGGALYNVTHDPEGLLSSLPALATVLIGASAALTMRDADKTPERKATTLALAGAASLSAGHLWHRSFPINKNLWTSSYVLVSGGWSLLSLAALYWLYDIRHAGARSSVMRALTRPANIFGANALVVYAVSVAVHKTLRTIHVPYAGHTLSLRSYVYRRVFARTRSTAARSLAFAVTYAAICFLPNLLLWRRKMFIKI